MGLLNNKTALITGATDVYGKAIALRFAEEGANIAFADTIVYEDIHDLEKEIEAKGMCCPHSTPTTLNSTTPTLMVRCTMAARR